MSPVSGRRIIASVAGRTTSPSSRSSAEPSASRSAARPIDAGSRVTKPREALHVDAGGRGIRDLMRVGCLVQREPVGADVARPASETRPPTTRRWHARSSRRCPRRRRTSTARPYRRRSRGRAREARSEALRRVERRLDDPGCVAREVAEAHDVVASAPNSGRAADERRLGREQPALDRRAAVRPTSGFGDREQPVVVVGARRSREPVAPNASSATMPSASAMPTHGRRQAPAVDVPARPVEAAESNPVIAARLVALGRERARRRASRSVSSEASGPNQPCARACTSTLPSAVASTGPASTGRPGRSAVRWQSSG